jgi:type I restriction enzyme M protein
MTKLSSWISETRKQTGLSQAAVGEKVGASQAQISQWENGKSTPSQEQLAKLEKVLGKHDAPKQAALDLGVQEPAESAPKSRGKAKPAEPAKEERSLEKALWAAADKFRGNIDASDYKHVVLGLVFLKYVSDVFEDRKEALKNTEGADLDDPEEYRMADDDGAIGFWVPEKARWPHIQAHATQPNIGQIIDTAMQEIAKENKSLQGSLPDNYSRPALDKRRLGELINVIANIHKEGPEQSNLDLFGRIYEYFIGEFAANEGKSGGEFYTPAPVVKLIVEMIEPFAGRVYDPACGSGGMFVQSSKFVSAHGGNAKSLSVFGQELNETTWRLARMNLAIRGIEANLGPKAADTFHEDLHMGLKANFCMANPPFNISDWGGERLREDVRWKTYGPPPVGNANFAWMQHILSHLDPSNGVAGVVMANGSLSSQQSNEGEIRRRMVEGDVVDCIVALPGQLFYTTQIPACIWFFSRNKAQKEHRNRKGEVLFIDCRKLGVMISRVQRELTAEDLARVARTYHAWRGEKSAGKYVDIKGFCKSAKLEEIKAAEFVLTPGRYVGAEDVAEDGEPFEAKMKRLTVTLEEQFAESGKLEKVIQKNLRAYAIKT